MKFPEDIAFEMLFCNAGRAVIFVVKEGWFFFCFLLFTANFKEFKYNNDRCAINQR